MWDGSSISVTEEVVRLAGLGLLIGHAVLDNVEPVELEMAAT